MLWGIVDVPLEFGKSIASKDAERIGAASFNLGMLLYGGGKTAGSRTFRGLVGNQRGSFAPKKPSIKWDQKSQRWRDIATGQYTKGPKMPKGFGKPSTWKEGSKDVSNEMIATKKGQKVYESMRDSSIQNDFISAFEKALKDLLNKN